MELTKLHQGEKSVWYSRTFRFFSLRFWSNNTIDWRYDKSRTWTTKPTALDMDFYLLSKSLEIIIVHFFTTFSRLMFSRFSLLFGLCLSSSACSNV